MTARWSRNPEVLWRRCGEKVVMLAPGSDDLLVLGGSGQHTWELLAEPIRSDDLAASLAELYGTDVTAVAHELGAFLVELESVGAAALTQ